MATNPNHEFRQVELQLGRLRECIEEVKRLNEMARQLLQKCRGARESKLD